MKIDIVINLELNIDILNFGTNFDKQVWLQRRTQNPVQYLRWNSMLDVLIGF